MAKTRPRPVRTRRRNARRTRDALAAFALAIAAGIVALAMLYCVASFVRGVVTRHKASLSMSQARAANAAVPFVPGPVLPASRFVFHGTPAAREQAIQCLATVALYEAGDDARGQRAVMQVVLNRVRRSGFSRTVCGVVYQRSVPGGVCQFSFACDGSLSRRPETAGWVAARARARHALAGTVFGAVGTATHYHTDWVVPWWSGSLDKIAKVGTHIFYRPKRG